MLTNAFVIFNFCYQIGVFLSRSSLACFKVKRVWIITLLQLFNFVFFMANSFNYLCRNIYILFSVMICVGLMGGSSFVNVIYLLKNTKLLKRTEKELALNLLSCFDDAGILMASILSLILSLTCFAQYTVSE